MGGHVAEEAREANHEARQEVLVLCGCRQETDQHRVKDLDRHDDRDHPKRTKCSEVLHLRNRGQEDHEETRDVGNDAEGAGHDEFTHRDRGGFNLRRFGIPHSGQQNFIVLEEPLGHLHGVGNCARSND